MFRFTFGGSEFVTEYVINCNLPVVLNHLNAFMHSYDCCCFPCVSPFLVSFNCSRRPTRNTKFNHEYLHIASKCRVDVWVSGIETAGYLYPNFENDILEV